MNIVNDILVNTLFSDTDFVQTLEMNSVVPKYVENQEKGNPSVCKNCAEAPFADLQIYGRSEQTTTTGAQLLDLDAISLATGGGATIKRLDDGGFLVDGTPEQAYEQYITKVVINLAPGTYFVSGGRAADGCAAVQINILNADGTRTYKNNASFDVSGTEQEITLVIQSVSEKPINNYKIYPMINSGSVAMPFEPYTGGKPSPSPDYPQEIKNAGDDGSLNVMVRGKNIFGGKFHYASYSNSMLLADKWRINKEVELPYQPEKETYGICKVLKCQKGKTYVLSVINPNKNATIGMTEFKNIENIFNGTDAIGFAAMTNKTKRLYTAKSDGILVCGIAGTWTDGKTTTHECTESELLQVEEASEATSYEPYHEPQSMSVTTPNGLPGIPVTSGGNYTDENGQQWICDEVDFGRGVYVQRIGILILDDKSSLRSVSKWDNTHLDVVQPYRVDGVTMSNKKVICDRLLSDEMREAWDRGIEMIGGVLITDESGFYIDFYIKNQHLGTTKDTIPDDATTAVLKWLKDNPLSCKYALPIPVESPLTASEIAAYKSLRTYKGTTIVEAEDKAGISVKYNMPMPKLSKNGALRRWFKRHPII